MKRPVMPEKLIDIHKRELYPIACHEAAHYIVGLSLGFKCTSIFLEATSDDAKTYNAGASVELYCELDDIPASVDFYEKRVKMLLAGAIGETLNEGNTDMRRANKLWKESAKSDYDKADALLKLLYNAMYNSVSDDQVGKKIQDIFNKYEEEANDLVKNYASVIIALAEYIMDRDFYCKKEVKLDEEVINALPMVRKFIEGLAN